MNRSEKNSETPPTIGSANHATKVPTMLQLHDLGEPADRYASIDLSLDLREIYFLIMHFLSGGPCKKTFRQMYTELQEHQLLPRRYHAWYSRDGANCGEEGSDGNSLPLNYDDLVGRYSHIRRDHLVWLLKELMSMISPPLRCSTQSTGKNVPSATDVPTLLGSGSFSLLSYDRNKGNKWMRKPQCYLHWPHVQADQVRGLSLREIGGGIPRHHRAPSIRLACYTIAKPSSMVRKMQNMKKLRGHRNAVYCAIFDRTGRHVITGSDDRLVKIWSMETALCLASCRGHEGDITDLSVSSNNAVVASASNDFTIRVWRLPDGYPISVLRGHTGAVTAIAFSPSSRPSSFCQLLSSSDDGTCRIWDARYSDSHPRVYMPKPNDVAIATGSGFLSASAPSNNTPSHQILFCAYNANGTAFVTGSSDTFARVWSACKPSMHEPAQPIHEMDILAGHENDVNYVQFSGCAVGLHSSPSDCCTEDGIPKFKNSWFNHDSIVTCSRDGSAIIWVPKLRRSHGKVARWVRSYHLKVPPPPMPPRPTRGGPRQRFLPTPRGVNMIVWSLDNRFVLAAIMDNRICVWNAIDGSLVHSLAGHTASTYVLDVHPFNPRIALSAGYDGKTILWDIWEGTPAKVYDLGGCLKLVDGKFSQDGTSIVLSDDLGQIYLINTGEGESYKDAQYDQFFLGDYRPLTQDTHGNVVDQETQLSPYLRNIQDILCDSGMLPYPEPYQSMYQRRRLGALGIEWRPSHIKFAIGTDIGMGQDIPPLPLPDLDVVEPLPDYGDAIFWEPENDGINDDNDSEYNANEEIFSEELNKCSDNTSGSECGEGDNDKQTQKDYTRRSKRRKYAGEVELTSDICTKNRNKDGKEGTSSRPRTYTKSKFVLRSSEPQPSILKSLRSQRAAARSAVSSFSNSAETSLDEEDGEFLLSESDSDLSLEDEEHSDYLANKRSFGAVRSAPSGCEDLNSLRQPGPRISGGNQKRLVVKFSCKQKSAPMSSDNRVDQVTGSSSSLRSYEDNLVQKIVDSGSRNLDSSSSSMHGRDPLDNYRRQSEDEERTLLDGLQCIASTSSGDANVRWGKIKIRMPNSSLSGASIPVESTAKTSDTCQPTRVEDMPSAVLTSCAEQLKDDGSAIIGHNFDGSTVLPSSHDGIKLHIVDKHSSQMPNSAEKKRNVIKIESTKFSGYTTSHFKPKATSGSASEAAMECQAASLSRNSSELLDIATDSANRTTLHKNKGTKQDFGLAGNNQGSRDDYLNSNTCIDREMCVKDDDCFLSDGSNRGEHGYRECSYFVETSKNAMPGKSNWLLLTGQEGGYRYIPQLGDEVVYLKQGHKDFIVRTQPTQHDNGLSYGDSLGAVETCSVDDLEYASHTGSGESCCQITLKLIDPKCRAYGKRIQLTLPELDDFPDFIVEKMWYDANMERNWSVGEKCLVWWRDNTEQAGSWWEGQITAIIDKDSKFPGSPWERYLVQYETDAEIHRHCPWELHGSQGQWEQPTIDSKIRDSILSSFNKLFRKAHNNKDSYGIIKLNEASLKMDFVNRFPVPLSLNVIKTRLENDYYRSLTALKHDFKVMISNAESYFHKNPGVLRKIKHLEAWFSEIFTLL